MLCDSEVLSFIQEKRAQLTPEDLKPTRKKRHSLARPQNLVGALRRHETYLNSEERPFRDNGLYDKKQTYLMTFMARMEKQIKLTRSEMLMVVNLRPHTAQLLSPLIEEYETRMDDEKREKVLAVIEETLGQAQALNVAGEEGQDGEDTEMTG